MPSFRLNRNKRFVILFALVIAIPGMVTGQDSLRAGIDSGCIQKDLGDVIRAALHKAPKIKPEASGSLLLLPIIGSNPATGFMVGIGGQYAFKMKGSTLYSNFSGSAQFTTKSQVIFMLKNNVYTKSNRIFFSGDWRYLIYSQSTYGLGTNSPEGGLIDYQYNLMGVSTTDDSLTQPMKFNFGRFHQSVSYKITHGFYAGLGLYYDSYKKIKDEKLMMGPSDTMLTSHYVYNTHYNFSTTGYSISAVNIKAVYDTRDNMINPYKGIYAMASWRGGFKFLGNKNYSNFTQIEFRGYHSFSESNPRHLIAVWLMGDFSPVGELPYLVLPATSYDQRGRSGRGYTQGRYRGSNLVYGEAEYRFPISRCGGILGGVVFLNGTTSDNPILNLNLFESIKPGYGAGLRIMVDKRSRTNLAVDVGFGDNSFGFYLAASEAF
jgi:outer membrane protein assembly factor BamA